MLDDDPDVRRLFSQIGQIAAYGRLLHQALHDGCSAIFIAQGFDPDFARSMMDKQEATVVRKTWFNLIKDELELTAPSALVPLGRLSGRLIQAIEAREKILDLAWIADAPRPVAIPHYEQLPEPTLAGGGVPLDRLVLDQANLSAALALIAGQWAERGEALLQQAWEMVEA